MDLILFVVMCVFFAGCLAVFITIMALPPKNVNPAASNPVFPLPLGFQGGFQQSFNQSDGAIHIQDETKPFALTAVTNGPVKPGFVFTGPLAYSLPETVQTSRGFTFYVTSAMSLVGLQVIDALFETGERTVGVYNVGQRTLLASALVSKDTDPVFFGMRTHTLQLITEIILQPNTLYACVAQTLVGDLYVLSTNFAFPPHEVVMDPLLDEQKLMAGYTGSVPSASLALPTNFVSTGPSSPFAGFQVEEKNVVFNSFAVDTQFGRFPPKYANGLSVLITTVDKIQVFPGVASSAYDNANLISNNLINYQVVSANLQPDTWYSVFLADAAYNDNLVEIILSPNWLEPPQLPIDRFRRIGWARTKPSSTNLFLLEQQGTGITRTSFYLEQAAQASVVVTPIFDDGSELILTLSYVPPTATQVRILVHSEWVTPTADAFTIDFDSTSEPFFAQHEQVQNVTLPIISTTQPPQTVLTFHLPSGGTNQLALEFFVLGYVEDL